MEKKIIYMIKITVLERDIYNNLFTENIFAMTYSNNL